MSTARSSSALDMRERPGMLRWRASQRAAPSSVRAGRSGASARRRGVTRTCRRASCATRSGTARCGRAPCGSCERRSPWRGRGLARFALARDDVLVLALLLVRPLGRHQALPCGSRSPSAWRCPTGATIRAAWSRVAPVRSAPRCDARGRCGRPLPTRPGRPATRPATRIRAGSGAAPATPAPAPPRPRGGRSARVSRWRCRAAIESASRCRRSPAVRARNLGLGAPGGGHLHPGVPEWR